MRPPTDFSQPVSTKADAAPEWSQARPVCVDDRSRSTPLAPGSVYFSPAPRQVKNCWRKLSPCIRKS
jgi:hypothetical protein